MTIGDNSNLNADERRKLEGYVSEIERLEADKSVISKDISEIYKSLKETGFDTKAIRHTIKLRKMDAEERGAFETACDAYSRAFGDFASSELGRAMAPK